MNTTIQKLIASPVKSGDCFLPLQEYQHIGYDDTARYEYIQDVLSNQRFLHSLEPNQGLLRLQSHLHKQLLHGQAFVLLLALYQ